MPTYTTSCCSAYIAVRNSTCTLAVFRQFPDGTEIVKMARCRVVKELNGANRSGLTSKPCIARKRRPQTCNTSEQVVQMSAIRTMFGRLGYCLIVIVVALVVAAAADNTESDSPPPAADPASATAHSDIQRQPIDKPDETRSEGELDLKDLDKELFKRLFAKRRKEHLEAVKNLQKMDNYERQYKMINMLAERMFDDVIESKRVLLENLTESDLKNVSFAAKSNSKTVIADAISNVLENIALFGDVVLSLPDITRRVVRKQPKWNATIRWSFEFLNRTRDLLDKSTLEMTKLVLQELNMSERAANLSNPNRIPGATRRPKKAKKEPPSKSKEKRKKGPTMTRVEL